MNGKKPLMNYRRVQKLQTPLLLSGALLSGVGTSVSIPLVILGIAIMLFAIVIGVLYYRCPHCGRPRHVFMANLSFAAKSPLSEITDRGRCYAVPPLVLPVSHENGLTERKHAPAR